MKSVLCILFFSSFWFSPQSLAAKSPCDSQASAQSCNSGNEDWRQIAIQHYDESSPVISIWEKSGQRVICSDPGPLSCPSYGGDVEQFKADAAKETSLRANRAALDAKHQQPIKNYGEGLKKNGWKEIARCEDGQEWSYILEKAGERRLCTGINSRGGPTEKPCSAFTGNLMHFKKIAAVAQNYKDDYQKASHAGKIDEFLKRKVRAKSIPHCWSDKD